jgi:carboxyl-terminal processing protease
VQNVRNLEDGSAVLITVAKYLTPNGSDISKKGIYPDVTVEVPTPEAEAYDDETNMPEEEKDVQLKKAIEVLKGKIAKNNGKTESSRLWKWNLF